MACGVCDGEFAEPALAGLRRCAAALGAKASFCGGFGWNRQIANYMVSGRLFKFAKSAGNDLQNPIRYSSKLLN